MFLEKIQFQRQFQRIGTVDALGQSRPLFDGSNTPCRVSGQSAELGNDVKVENGHRPVPCGHTRRRNSVEDSGLKRSLRLFRHHPAGTASRTRSVAPRNSCGVLFVERRKARRKLAASLNPSAKAMSSCVIDVSRRYFMAT